MPLNDLRPGSGTSGGGGGVSNPTIDQTKSDWQVVEISLSALDLANGFITLPLQPQDTKVLVDMLEGPTFDAGVDYNINQPLSRIEFLADSLALMLSNFNTYGKVTIKAAYFAITV